MDGEYVEVHTSKDSHVEMQTSKKKMSNRRRQLTHGDAHADDLSGRRPYHHRSRRRRKPDDTGLFTATVILGFSTTFMLMLALMYTCIWGADCGQCTPGQRMMTPKRY